MIAKKSPTDKLQNKSAFRFNLFCTFAALLLLIFFPQAWNSPNPQVRSISTLLFALTGIGWLILVTRSKQPFYAPKVVAPIFTYLLLLAILLGVTQVFAYGMDWLINGLILMLSFLFAANALQGDCKARTWENTLIGIGLAFVFADSLVYPLRLWQWSQISGDLFSPPPVGLRIFGAFFGHPNLYGGYLNLIIPLVLMRLLRQTKIVRRILWLAALGAFLAMHYMTSSRSAWAALVGLIGVMVALRYFHLIKGIAVRRKIPVLNLGKKMLLAGIIALLILIPVSLLLIRQVQTGAHGTLSQRLSIWLYGVDLITESPFYGHGPGAVLFRFAQRSDGIGDDEVFHTHNIILETAATAGILGLCILGWGIALTIRAFSAAWHCTPQGSEDRDRLIAYAGAGAGLAIHGMLDVLVAPLIFSMCILFILALMYQLAPVQAFYVFNRKNALSILAIMLATCIAGAYYVLKDTRLMGEGFQAATNSDWNTAQQKICRAARLNPEKTFDSFQCSLASAFVSLENNDLNILEDAISIQSQALKKDPYWYMHWANLASFEWHLGEYQQAQEHMQKVVEMAPKRTLFLINLGWMEEHQGQNVEALEHYRIAACLEPGYRYTLFFDQTPLRQQALVGDCPPESDSLAKSEYLRAFWSGVEALRANELKIAESSFQRAIQLDPHSSISYSYLGLVHQKIGQSDAAWQEARTALYINNKSSASYLIAAQIASEQNMDELAVEYLLKAFDLIQMPNYSSDYYVRTYHYIGLPTDFSPYLIRTTLSVETQDSLLYLEQHLAQIGKTETAQEILRWVDNNLQMIK